MFLELRRKFKKKKLHTLDPDQIFLDDRNLPSFDNQQFEGRMEKPLPKKVFLFTGVLFSLMVLGFTIKLTELQIVKGEELSQMSDINKLSHKIIFPDRGIIYDRNGLELAWNNPSREYTEKDGFSHII